MGNTKMIGKRLLPIIRTNAAYIKQHINDDYIPEEVIIEESDLCKAIINLLLFKANRSRAFKKALQSAVAEDSA